MKTTTVGPGVTRVRIPKGHGVLSRDEAAVLRDFIFLLGKRGLAVDRIDLRTFQPPAKFSAIEISAK